MAFKEFALNERTTVTIYKKKSSRSLRLSIGANGKIRVTIPLWAPYTAGLSFARSRQAWIDEQAPAFTLLRHNQAIGKAHHLYFVEDSALHKPTSRLKTAEAIVSYPSGLAVSHPSVQASAQAVSIRALRSQAEALLPKRLETLAEKHQFVYGSVAVKRLKSRWGSCDSQKNIVLNLFLMQLPWESIDYVLLHELTHTRVLQHGPAFWEAMEHVLPDAKKLRKTLRSYQPVLQ
jgi:predicted metal-dependent hydrolase